MVGAPRLVVPSYGEGALPYEHGGGHARGRAPASGSRPGLEHARAWLARSRGAGHVSGHASHTLFVFRAPLGPERAVEGEGTSRTPPAAGLCRASERPPLHQPDPCRVSIHAREHCGAGLVRSQRLSGPAAHPCGRGHDGVAWRQAWRGDRWAGLGLASEGGRLGLPGQRKRVRDAHAARGPRAEDHRDGGRARGVDRGRGGLRAPAADVGEACLAEAVRVYRLRQTPR